VAWEGRTTHPAPRRGCESGVAPPLTDRLICPGQLQWPHRGAGSNDRPARRGMRGGRSALRDRSPAIRTRRRLDLARIAAGPWGMARHPSGLVAHLRRARPSWTYRGNPPGRGRADEGAPARAFGFSEEARGESTRDRSSPRMLPRAPGGESDPRNTRHSPGRSDQMPEDMETDTTPAAQDDVAPPVDEELDEGLGSLALVAIAFVGGRIPGDRALGRQAPRAEARHAPSLAHGAGGGTGGPRLAPALARGAAR
jgi:hypothetical protein